ncbi:hypothetical protein BLOT_013400 [Blomia tropicalis]|nr:hypothetical protein BLOT_013400 [Blomia tropicalis]
MPIGHFEALDPRSVPIITKTKPTAMANIDSFYSSYQPSQYSEDQEKIEDWFNGADTLNTPDINPEFFDSPLLFANEKIDIKPAIKSEMNECSFITDITGYNQSLMTTMPALTNPSNPNVGYSPSYSEKLESSSININSPEMMPVSPNKVCPQLENIYEDDSNNNYSLNDFGKQTLINFDYMNGNSTNGSSQCNSRSSSISSGSGLSMITLNDQPTYLGEIVMINNNDIQLNAPTNVPLPTTTTTVMGNTTNPNTITIEQQMNETMCRMASTPESISSTYSTESNQNKTFTNLDNVAQFPMIAIKQEPTTETLYQPTVVGDYECLAAYSHVSPQQSQLTHSTNGNYCPSTNELDNFYQYTTASSLPSTVTSIIQQQQQQTQLSSGPQQKPTSPTTNGRKRNAHSMSSPGTSTGTITKKPRMTKREKQKMLENTITEYETNNRELKATMDLLMRQVQYCKRYLSERVAPVIQRQQHIDQHQFNSPQRIIES